MKIGLPKLTHAPGLLLAALVVVVALAPAAAAVDNAASYKHAPIRMRRNSDASIARGVRGEMQSSNWSGYVVAHYVTGIRYIAASMAWVVPAVTYGSSTDTTNSNEYSANWVGIGGFCRDSLCTRVDHTLIQLGTEQDVTPGGATRYYAWYEVLPQAETPLSRTTYPVAPGDAMTASLSCGATCSQKTQTWLLSMRDETQGWSWSKRISYGSFLASAEWIVEAPYGGGILPLANVGTAAFSATGGTDGVTPSFSVDQNGIQLVDPWGQTANPSAPDAFADFNACWGFESFASCPTP